MLRPLALMVLLVLELPVQAFEILQPLPEEMAIPKNNPLTESKSRLGQKLFFDSRLSRSGRISCNHCHNVMGSAADGLSSSIGESGKALKRNTPSLWNVAYQTVYFWDGRAKSLETAIEQHILDVDIMAMPSRGFIYTRFRNIPGYKRSFQRIFKKKARLQQISMVLASYIRTLRTPDSPFDRYIKGDERALSAKALKGLKEFQDVQCVACHFGVNFAGPAPGPAMGMGQGFYELFPNHLGSTYDESHKIAEDLGRYLVTKDPGHKYMWRVPPLRNIALTAPYFHNGSAKTLHEAVRIMAKTQLKRDLNKKQVDQIVAFLNSLTGKRPKQELPSLPSTPNTTLFRTK